MEAQAVPHFSTAEIKLMRYPSASSIIDREQVNSLLAAINSLTAVLAVVVDDEDGRLLLGSEINLAMRAKSLELCGTQVIDNCLPFLRNSNFSITMSNTGDWSIRYKNVKTGEEYEPSAYLRLAMDNPRAIPLPILSFASLKSLVNKGGDSVMPLYELDFYALVSSGVDYSRALQFAMRHRLRRYLLRGT